MTTIMHFDMVTCPLGQLLVAKSTKGLAAIFIGDHPSLLIENLKTRFSNAALVQDKNLLAPLIALVINYLENPLTQFDYPFDLQGSDFQINVWNELKKIPYGKTVTYSDLAKNLQMPKAMRAIANACGANPIAIIIPCHRVIRKDSSLSGYRWGVDVKRKLLELEQAI